MHTIIAAALTTLGVTAKSQAAGVEPPFTGSLCFQHFTAGDLLIQSAKVVGSAQRRQRGALMQHGSILLTRSPYAPVLPGINELSGRNVSVAQTCEAVETQFGLQTGWQLLPDGWTTAERAGIDRLATAKYGHDNWNRKR
jgi:lipoate-protein ligase A